MEIIDLASEVKYLHSELIRKDQQAFNLKDKVHELNLEVNISNLISSLSPCFWYLYFFFLIKKLANQNRIANGTSLTNNSDAAYKRNKNNSDEETSHYENRIQELKKTLEENQHDKQRLIEEVHLYLYAYHLMLSFMYLWDTFSFLLRLS